VEIDLSEAAGREDRLAREQRRHAVAVAGEKVGADDRRSVVPVGRVRRVVRERQEVDRGRLEPPSNVLLVPAGGDERLLDRRPGRVLDVEHAARGMGTLESPVKSRALAVEGDAELVDEKRPDEIRALAGEKQGGLGRAEPVARALDVGGEPFGRVSRRPRDDAALRVEGVRLLRLLGARDDRDGRAAARGRQGGRAAGDTGAQDEDVGRLLVHPTKSSSETSAASTEWVSAPTETPSAPARA
jgi:hypothetical protein